MCVCVCVCVCVCAHRCPNCLLFFHCLMAVVFVKLVQVGIKPLCLKHNCSKAVLLVTCTMVTENCYF